MLSLEKELSAAQASQQRSRGGSSLRHSRSSSSATAWQRLSHAQRQRQRLVEEDGGLLSTGLTLWASMWAGVALATKCHLGNKAAEVQQALLLG